MMAGARLVSGVVMTPLVVLGLTSGAGATTFSFTAEDFVLKNDAVLISNTGGVVEMQLTPPTDSKKGGFWSSNSVSLYDNFVLDGEIYLGHEAEVADSGLDPRGADGIAFTIYKDIPSNLDAGGSLGYSGTGDVFAIEWDTYHNGELGDLGSEGLDMSMALAKNTADHTVIGALYAPVVLIPRATMHADDGNWRKFQISWYAPDQAITVKYDMNRDGVFGADETIFTAVYVNLLDEGGLFAGTDGQVHWGFTASTGLYVNDQRVRIASNALTVTTPPPPPYLGPVLSTIEPNPVRVGNRVLISGVNLESVTDVRIDGIAVLELEVTNAQISFIVPQVSAGLKSLAIISGFGSLSAQDILQVMPSRATAGSSEPRATTKRIGDSVRLAVHGVVGAGKVQFFHNGNEVAWIRAVDATDPKLNVLSDGMVRTRALVSGRNVFEIKVNGVQLVRRIATGS